MAEPKTRRDVIVFAAIGVVAALLVFLFVPFSADTTMGGKAVFAVLLGGLAAYGAWSFAGIPALLRDGFSFLRQGTKRAAPPPSHHQGPLPELTPQRAARVRKVLAVMAEGGVFGDNPPDPAKLYPGMAEHDYAVRPDTVLAALAEADYYFPDFDPAAHMANLVMHDSKAEQSEGVIAAHIADLVRLSDGGLVVSDVRVRQDCSGNGRVVPTVVEMTVNGEDVRLEYPADIKYLSTIIHAELAKRLKHAGTGRRLAWLWDDQGAWISDLPDGAVEVMNSALKLDASRTCVWEWMDVASGFAAGEPLPG